MLRRAAMLMTPQSKWLFAITLGVLFAVICGVIKVCWPQWMFVLPLISLAALASVAFRIVLDEL